MFFLTNSFAREEFFKFLSHTNHFKIKMPLMKARGAFYITSFPAFLRLPLAALAGDLLFYH